MPEGTLCNKKPVNTMEQLQALLADKYAFNALMVALVILLATWLGRRVEGGSRIAATLGSLVLALVPVG